MPEAGGALIGMDYLSADRVEIRYTLPLAEIIFDFFDQLKSRTRGYASLDYEPDGEQESNLVKVDILLQGQPVDAFSQIVHADEAREYGLSMTAKLKELIPRQQYEVRIQAAVGARIIARENIRDAGRASCPGLAPSRRYSSSRSSRDGGQRRGPRPFPRCSGRSGAPRFRRGTRGSPRPQPRIGRGRAPSPSRRRRRGR